MNLGEIRSRKKTFGRASCPAATWTTMGWRRTGFRRQPRWSLNPGSGPDLIPRRGYSRTNWLWVRAVGRPVEQCCKAVTSSLNLCQISRVTKRLEKTCPILLKSSPNICLAKNLHTSKLNLKVQNMYIKTFLNLKIHAIQFLKSFYSGENVRNLHKQKIAHNVDIPLDCYILYKNYEELLKVALIAQSSHRDKSWQFSDFERPA